MILANLISGYFPGQRILRSEFIKDGYLRNKRTSFGWPKGLGKPRKVIVKIVNIKKI
jgi:hypothetical protein